MTEKDSPRVVIFPPLAVAIALVVGIALQWLYPLRFMQPRGFGNPPVIGTVLIVVAFVIAIWSIRSFRAAGTNINPAKPALVIVKSGPYRFSRNPMYLTLLLAQAGIGLAFSIEWVLVITPALWAVLHFGVVLREEVYLEAKFGDDFGALKSRTRRWI